MRRRDRRDAAVVGDAVAHARPRAGRRWGALLGLGSALAIAAVTAVAGPAAADGYPSWGDVQKAKANESAAAAQVTKIKGLIADLETDVSDTQAEAEKRGTELETAQRKFDEADLKARQLSAQATASRKEASEATTRAGRLAAQLYRSGGHLSAGMLFTDRADADDLLADLGSMSKLLEHNSDVYWRALTAQNTADSVSDQAEVAKKARDRLKSQARTALKEAAAAAEAAQDRLTEQQEHIVTLKAQLAALQDKTAKTVSGYKKGVAARKAAEEAARRAAAKRAAARAAEQARVSGGNAGQAGPQGWAVPVNGPITDGFGARPQPCPTCSSYHLGTDIGAACGTPIHVAHDGVVVFAGPNGTYGNVVYVDNGGGIQTRYAHIRPGGIAVGYGQHVSVGQTIAYVGQTGAATGCHLHYEMRRNGQAISGISFMAQKGVPIG